MIAFLRPTFFIISSEFGCRVSHGPLGYASPGIYYRMRIRWPGYLAVLSAIATLAKPDRAGVGRDVSTWYNAISTYKDGMYTDSRHIYTYHNI